MGTQLQYRCPACGKGFAWRQGPGRMFRVVHCDRCGKELAVELEDLPLLEAAEGALPCSCGGHFSEEALRRCPFCHHLVPDDCLASPEVVLYD